MRRFSKEGQTYGDGKRPDLGAGHAMEYTNGVLWRCIPETFIILLTKVTRINVKEGREGGREGERGKEREGEKEKERCCQTLPLAFGLTLFFSF